MAMLDDLLDLSKLNAERIELEKVPFDLKQTTQSATRLTRSRLEEKGLTYIEEIDPDIPPLLIGDPSRLRQILVNLVGNATKFTDEGSVALRLKLVEVESNRARIEIRVEDTGIGISAERLDGIFDEFVQGGSFVSRVYGGTGLGLTICKRLVEAMGGKIELTSRLHKGTTVDLRLEFEIGEPSSIGDDVSPQEAVDTQEAIDFVRQRQPRILAADDNEINRKVLKSLVSPYCSELVMVNSGEAAVMEASNAHFDVILLDVQMPGMNGMDAASEIRSQNGRCAATPTIAITANAFDSDRTRYLSNGFDGYVTKPVILSQLLVAIYGQLKDRDLPRAVESADAKLPEGGSKIS
jgi:CheY-like chemotaxis protein